MLFRSVVDATVASGSVVAAIRGGGGDIVEEVRVFDRFVGVPLAPGKASLAYAVTFRAADRTLTDADVQLTFDRVLHALVREHGAEQR